MNLDEIKEAVDAGRTVHWSNEGYTVVRAGGPGSDGELLIRCNSNSHCIGLTHQDGVTLNGEENEFYIGGMHRYQWGGREGEWWVDVVTDRGFERAKDIAEQVAQVDGQRLGEIHSVRGIDRRGSLGAWVDKGDGAELEGSERVVVLR